MLAVLTSSTIRRFCAILATTWLLGAGAARAEGGGGEDLGTVLHLLETICGLVGQDPCPKVPTITQGILEIAALFNARPEAIRYGQTIPAGITVNAGNPPVPEQPAVALSSLTPLAFVSRPKGEEEEDGSAPHNSGQARPTQLYDPTANIFFYAVTTVPTGGQPNALMLFYDDLSRDKRVFKKDQIVAEISLPLVVLSNDGTETERPVMTILEIRAVCTGGPGCVTASAIGDFVGNGTQQRHMAAEIGVDFKLVFGPSPVSRHPHAIFQVRVPLIVTYANDVAYLSPLPSNITTQGIPFPPFVIEDLGFTPAFLGGKSIGIAPVAAPLGPPPATGVIPFFGFCASLPDNSNSTRAGNLPAVGTFLVIGTDGETLVSSPLPSAGEEVRCPF